MDEVDGIVAAWQRERPDLDVSALAVLSRVDRLAAELASRRRRVFVAHHLALHEFDVLAALRRSGPPYELTAGQLAADTHVTSGTMTNRISGLVQRRLVRRAADPVDGRISRIRLGAAGRTRVDAAITDLLGVENDLLRALPASGRRGLASALQVVLSAVQAAPATG
ncbi:MAG: MarR family winged helix-turn-helix transcriptional regulator [Jatrophihabitans sp.]